MIEICKLTFGTPENITPVKFKKSSLVNYVDSNKIDINMISFNKTSRGCKLELPLEADEEIYGFGLQLKGFNHKGGKKTMRPNADSLSDSGDSHAPVPFYVTTKGYGVYVDTARYVDFYCGFNSKGRATNKNIIKTVGISTNNIYRKRGFDEQTKMIIDIPTSSGVDIYIFEGESITEVISKYNMFSGGGCMPSIWGLGFFYRCYARHTEKEIANTAMYFRNNKIPCDIIGLEPGWQSNSYPCSFLWDNDRYPNHKELISFLRSLNYNINLWEHAFIDKSAQLYDELINL